MIDRSRDSSGSGPVLPPFSGREKTPTRSVEPPVDRLPPPMFPPGPRRPPVRSVTHPARPEGDERVPQAAIIMPDEPAEMDTRGPGGSGEGVASGIGGRSASGAAAPESLPEGQRDPHLGELVRMVQRLADGLATRGEAGLRSTPGMTPFEATLRAYCVGFLAASRAGGKGEGAG